MHIVPPSQIPKHGYFAVQEMKMNIKSSLCLMKLWINMSDNSQMGINKSFANGIDAVHFGNTANSRYFIQEA